MEYSGASDLRRRSFLKLLGLAGVAATIDPSTLLDPAPAEIEAAHAAGVPISGEMWVNVPTFKQARRLGKLVNTSMRKDIFQVDRDMPTVETIGGHWEFHEASREITIDATLEDVDIAAVRSAMDERMIGTSIYLFGKKFHIEKSFMRQFAFEILNSDMEEFNALIEIKACSEVKIEEFRA